MKNETAKEKKKIKQRRCNHKVVTKEATVLKIMRESRNVSMRRAGILIGVSASTISHLEHGRADLYPRIIVKLLEIYGYSYEQFISMSNGKVELPQSLRSECIEIIKRLDDEKLRTVKTILQSF
ncbi:MAG: helix-turn-helix domain-containing protein [Proteobacteria bacterium]|nr:helix-turn-helix domain-containing protein [Pseudomonadota bacterium]